MQVAAPLFRFNGIAMYRIAKRLTIASVTACLLLAAVLPWWAVNEGKVLARGFTIDVTDVGALGDGTTDDSAAFQAAIDRLAVTGGTLYVPANRTYLVKDVEVTSIYAVHIVSDMLNHVLGGAAANTWTAKGVIKPAAGAAYIFKWEKHAAITTGTGFGAGGSIIGVNFGDIATAGGSSRAVEISTAAVWIDDAIAFTIRDCEFQWLEGTAIRVDESTYCKIEDTKLYACGDDSPALPVIDAGGAATQAYLWTNRLFMENNYFTHIRLQASSFIHHANGYHENSGGIAACKFIDGTAAGGNVYGCIFNGTTDTSIIFGGLTAGLNGYSIQDCLFNNFPGANSTIKILTNSVCTRLSNLQISAAGQTGPVIEIDASECTLSNIYTLGGGQIKIDGASCALSDIYCRGPSTPSGQYQIDCTAASTTIVGAYINGVTTSLCHGIRSAAGTIIDSEVYSLDGGTAYTVTGTATIANCRAYALDGGTAFVKPVGTVFWGNYGDVGNEHKTRVLRTHQRSLLDFREIDGNADVGDIAANGGILASDTTPILRAETNGTQEIVWAAANADALVAEVSIPDTLDDTADVLIDLFVSTDNAGGGGVEPANFNIFTNWDAAALVGDTAIDGSPATTLHTITATIAASDVPAGARTMTVRVIPDTHANDPIRLHGWRVRANEFVTSN